jgi:hypothetical protein
MTSLSDIRREATRAGINRETFGEWMNFAIRAQRRNDLADVAYCGRKALDAYARFPTVVGPINDETLARARAFAEAA